MMKVTFPFFINARKSSLECAFVEDDCCGADLSGHSAGSLRLHSSMDDRGVEGPRVSEVDLDVPSPMNWISTLLWGTLKEKEA